MKAGAKEGSIGSKGAVAVTGRRSDLMINCCTCTRGSLSSSLHNLNKTDIPMTCKGCTGESTTDRGGPSCSSRLNGVGLELPRPIDPNVRWKTANGRRRATRRARTSFTGEDRMRDGILFHPSFIGFGSSKNQEMAHEDAPVSESEKFGVSVLGRRFSDPVENVPIKKRRFHMDCSPSPPSTPLLVDPYEKVLSSSSGGVPSYKKRCKVQIFGGECEGSKGLFDADDFSGISILAAAACESEMNVDILNGECSKLVHPDEETNSENTLASTELNLLHDMKKDMLNIPESSHCLYERPPESSNSAPDVKPLFDSTLTSSENLFESASAPKVDCSLYSALNSAKRTESASYAKSLSVEVPNSSNNPDKSVGCSQDANKRGNTSCDSRLHWDLNVAMEAWDTNCGDYDYFNDPAAPTVCVDDAGNDMKKLQAPHDGFDLTDDNAPNFSTGKVNTSDVPKDANTKDGDSPADTSSRPLHHQSSQNLKLMKSESLGNETSAETMVLPDQQKSRFASVMESNLGSIPESALIMEHLPLTANVEKTGCSNILPVSCEGLSHMSSANAVVGVNSIQTSEPACTIKPLASRLVSEESTNIPTVTAFHKKNANFGWSNNKLEEASEQSISEFKSQELFDVDSGTSKMDQSVISKKGEVGTNVVYVPKNTANTENFTYTGDKPRSSDFAMTDVHEDSADALINSKNCPIPCANSSSAETSYISGGTSQAPVPNSESHKPVITDADIIVDSKAAVHSCENGYKNELGKVALNHCYDNDTSDISKNLVGIGKVDVEEDDSQYEDGELRESGDRCWVDDVCEEVKHANWHYQLSDYKRDAATPDIPPPIDSVSKNVVIPAAVCNESRSRKEDDAVSLVLSKRSWSTNCLDGGSSAGGKADSIHLRMTSDTQVCEINSGRVMVGCAPSVSHSERCTDNLNDDPLSTRMKNTGWDLLPEDQRHPPHDAKDIADSFNLRGLNSLDAARGDDSSRKIELSNKDVQRVDRPRSFERPHRNEMNRSDDGYASGSKGERTIDSRRSRGYDASRHIQAGSHGEQWMENSKHPRSTRCKSPEYYKYGLSGPRNAAEAAVAKMESNGFVVARDGTLVRAVDAANSGHIVRRMKNTPSSSYRPLSGCNSPTDRDGACGLPRGAARAREASPERHSVASNNRSNRYGSEVEKDHTNGHLSSVHCSLSSRHRGIPTGRASLNLSRAHSRSPSGSRSRSPHDWASPRNSRKPIVNGGSTLRRHSRSPPNHMTKVRMGRMTSPPRQPGYDDRTQRYRSTSRNLIYSQHASTWVDGRNSSVVDHSNHNKRYTRRSPPMSATSRNDRFDVMDSQGRSRSGEFYRPTQGRPYGYDQGNKHDASCDDQREYTNRYGSHSVKPYDRNGAVKQFRNNTGDKFRTCISAPRSPELPRRASPRRFDRSFER